MRRGLGIFVLTAPTWATDVLILRARLLAFATYAGSLPHLKGVLVDGNVLGSLKDLKTFTVEESLEGVYATAGTTSQFFVSIVAVVVS
jgi:hypothetical protein